MTPLTRRATAAYRSATPDQVARGHSWYKDAHKIAVTMAERHGVSPEVASGVLAATSPRLGWGTNVVLAERLLASGGTLTRGALSNSLTAGRRIYAGEAPLDVLGGPKTRAFYEAILTAGESGNAVIDRHAWDLLTGVRQAPGPRRSEYKGAADTMARAAHILGVTVHEVQAVTWLVQRAKFWSDTAFNYTEGV